MLFFDGGAFLGRFDSDEAFRLYCELEGQPVPDGYRTEFESADEHRMYRRKQAGDAYTNIGHLADNNGQLIQAMLILLDFLRARFPDMADEIDALEEASQLNRLRTAIESGEMRFAFPLKNAHAEAQGADWTADMVAAATRFAETYE